MSEGLGAEKETTKAERIIAVELKRRQWKATKLQTRPKGDAGKLALAARSWLETTMTAGWIAERLNMGSRGYLIHLLYRRSQSRPEQPISRPFSACALTRSV